MKRRVRAHVRYDPQMNGMGQKEVKTLCRVLDAEDLRDIQTWEHCWKQGSIPNLLRDRGKQILAEFESNSRDGELIE